MDPVAQNRVWEEHCRSFSKTQQLSTSFNVPDPRKMNVMPEKPNRTVPAQNPDAETIQAATTLLKDLSCLKDTDKQPHERYALPVTANMEYGFFATQPLVPNNPMFDYKSRSCEVTRFAANFVTSVGHSPFAKGEGGLK